MLTPQQCKLVEDNIALANNFVRTQAFLRPLRHRLRCSWADMFSIARLALCRAAERFDPEQGAAFSTYFYTVCRGMFLVELRTTRNHRNSIMYSSVSYDEPVKDTDKRSAIDFAVDLYSEDESWVDLRCLIDSELTERERKCLALSLQGYSTYGIADIIGYSQQTARLALVRAREKIAKYL